MAVPSATTASTTAVAAPPLLLQEPPRSGPVVAAGLLLKVFWCLFVAAEMSINKSLAVARLVLMVPLVAGFVDHGTRSTFTRRAPPSRQQPPTCRARPAPW